MQLIILAYAAAYALIVLITWIRFKKSEWPQKPSAMFNLYEALEDLARSLLGRLWTWPKKTWKKAVAAILITIVVIVGMYILASVLSLAAKIAADRSLMIRRTPTVEVATQDDSSPTRPESSSGENRTKALLISFFATTKAALQFLAGVALAPITVILLFALASWRKARRERSAAKPGNARDQTAKPEKATAKGGQSLGWRFGKALLLAGLAGLCLVTWRFIIPIATVPPKAIAPSNPDITLTSGSERDYIKLPLKHEVTVVVMPSADTTAIDDEERLWTDWLVRPHNSMGSLTVAPYGLLDVEVSFADGSTRLFLDFKPTTEVVVRDKMITGMRFRNNRDKPVRVEIGLS